MLRGLAVFLMLKINKVLDATKDNESHESNILYIRSM